LSAPILRSGSRAERVHHPKSEAALIIEVEQLNPQKRLLVRLDKLKGIHLVLAAVIDLDRERRQGEGQ
jgi:hypothetical protein